MKTKAYINSDQADFLKSQTEVEDLNELNIHATAKKKLALIALIQSFFMTQLILYLK
jgi:hypothetical protein